jgi:hypothetical protein
MSETTSDSKNTAANGLSGFIAAAGVILAVSYPVLAISTGFRAVYQIIEGDPENAAYLSLLAALLYATATIGFVVRKRWAWRLSVGVLLFESLMTLVIGSLSFIEPELFGRNVWQFFGRDYGYFPLVQPILGLLWLFNPQTLVAYGIKTAKVQVETVD